MTTMTLNESFKALVREAFPDKSDKVISIFDEVVSHKASGEFLVVTIPSKQAVVRGVVQAAASP